MMLLTLLGKDARILLRNRPLLVALVLYPLLLAGVLGVAFREPPAHLDLAVFNGDAGGATIEVGGTKLDSSSLLSSTGSFASLHNASSEQAALAMVRRGDVDAALVIPQGFIGDLARLGSNASVRVIVDESDPVRAGIARSAVVGGIDAFVREVVARKISDVETLLNLTVHGGTTRIAFVDVNVLGIERSRAELSEVYAKLDPKSAEAQKVADVIAFLDFTKGVLGNSEVYLTTTAIPLEVNTSGLAHADTRIVSVALPGALVLGVFWTGALAAALLAARERETGVSQRLAAAHAPALLAPASKAIIALLAALLPASVLLVMGLVVLGADVRDPALTFTVLALASLAAAALGALCAAIARASAAATLLAVLALVPMLLLGGLFFPVAYMPAPAQAIARALPLTMATDALRGTMLRGSAVDELAFPILGLVATTLAFAAMAAVLSRRARAH